MFFGLALVTVISAWAIVFSQNIVRMAVYLLVTLAGAAGMYFMLDAEFLAAIQLIVYAGGTLILIIFGVMLTSKNPFLQLQVKPWEKILGLMLAVGIAGLMMLAIAVSPIDAGRALTITSGYNLVAAIGKLLLSTYLVPFEVSAVLLLVVMIAAAYMARRREG